MWGEMLICIQKEDGLRNNVKQFSTTWLDGTFSDNGLSGTGAYSDEKG